MNYKHRIAYLGQKKVIEASSFSYVGPVERLDNIIDERAIDKKKVKCYSLHRLIGNDPQEVSITYPELLVKALNIKRAMGIVYDAPGDRIIYALYDEGIHNESDLSALKDIPVARFLKFINSYVDDNIGHLRADTALKNKWPLVYVAPDGTTKTIPQGTDVSSRKILGFGEWAYARSVGGAEQVGIFMQSDVLGGYFDYMKNYS